MTNSNDRHSAPLRQAQLDALLAGLPEAGNRPLLFGDFNLGNDAAVLSHEFGHNPISPAEESGINPFYHQPSDEMNRRPIGPNALLVMDMIGMHEVGHGPLGMGDHSAVRVGTVGNELLWEEFARLLEQMKRGSQIDDRMEPGQPPAADGASDTKA